MKIGFIGLGKMGVGVVENLLRAGHDLTVWNRSPEPAEEMEAKGAVRAASPADMLQGEAMFSLLASDEAMRAVGLDGLLLDRAREGLIHANLATISIDFSKELAAAHRKRGLTYISANVFGRPEVAAKGELTVVAAGDANAIESLRPVLAAFAKRVAVVGHEPEKANLFKIAGNFMIAAALETMGEAFALLRKGGVDPMLFHDVMSNSLFQGPVYRGYGEKIARQEFEPAGFTLKLGRKDVGLALAAARELDVALPLAELVHSHFDAAMDAGMAHKDWSAISEVIAREAGL